MTIQIRLLLILFITMVKGLADQGAITPPLNEVWPSVNHLKDIFKARILGVEIYSPLAMPRINAEDTKVVAIEKLKQAGFGVNERDDVVNLTDAKERPTGKRPYARNLFPHTDAPKTYKHF